MSKRIKIELERAPGEQRLLVFEPEMRSGCISLTFLGWLDVGDVVADPSKYEFFPPPPGYSFPPAQRFGLLQLLVDLDAFIVKTIAELKRDPEKLPDRRKYEEFVEKLRKYV